MSADAGYMWTVAVFEEKHLRFRKLWVKFLLLGPEGAELRFRFYVFSCRDVLRMRYSLCLIKGWLTHTYINSGKNPSFQ